MLRRKKSESPDPVVEGDPSDKKGRPTPTRREAEAAARARAKAPRSRKDARAVNRAQRAKQSSKMREAMRTGDDRWLPVRDKGPVRRFIRDYVDVRISWVEILIPLMLITLILGWTGYVELASYANSILFAFLIVLVFNIWWMTRRLKRELANRFPDADPRGNTWYAVARSLQMKFMRLPKPQVKIGQSLPDSYR